MADLETQAANCRAKVWFRTRQQAKKIARRARQHATNRLRAYRCPACGYWHLTSQQNGKKDTMRTTEP